MNEQSTKKILFNKSTLLSLKAELLKKQEEVYEKKQLPQNKLENFKPCPAKGTDDDKCTKDRKKSFKDILKAVDTDELEACRKSKLALEKKSELYEHLSDKAGNSQLAEKFLVDFNAKKKEAVISEPSQDHEEDETNVQKNNDCENEWIEFTDCLGRTRKCHKSDIDLYMKRDKELMRIINKSNDDENLRNDDKLEDKNQEPEKPFLVQKTNDYLQTLRKKWEEKEQELLAKDKDIHYQDLLFDEARIHGVGYYAFSTDEAERNAQMEELKKRREETLRLQKETEELRKKRDEQMAARVAAARARQRERAGLPAEEPQEQPQKDFTSCLLEFLTQQRNDADAKAKEAEMKRREEQEKERQKLREAYVREWDLGKEGVDGNIKKFREMTQEEYVDQQRDKRIDEFAPLQATSSKVKDASAFFDNKGRKIQSTKETAVSNKTWSDVRSLTDISLPPDIDHISEMPEKKGLYFSTAKKDVKYRNFVKSTEPTPIINEISDEETNTISSKRKLNNNGVEIEPPPTYEYYGPIPKQTKTENPFKINVSEAYAQGAKSLEAKSSNIKLPQHYDFTFN